MSVRTVLCRFKEMHVHAQCNNSSFLQQLLNIEPYARELIRDAGRSVQLVFLQSAQCEH